MPCTYISSVLFVFNLKLHRRCFHTVQGLKIRIVRELAKVFGYRIYQYIQLSVSSKEGYSKTATKFVNIQQTGKVSREKYGQTEII
jgi:hypothetical protein